MLRLVFFVSICLVLVSGEPKHHLQNDSPLINSISACDILSIKDLVSQVVSLTSDTAITVVSSFVAVVLDLAFCLWPFDVYMCLESDIEYSIVDSIQLIGKSLVDYVQTLEPLLKEISVDVIACASV